MDVILSADKKHLVHPGQSFLKRFLQWLHTLQSDSPVSCTIYSHLHLHRVGAKCHTHCAQVLTIAQKVVAENHIPKSKNEPKVTTVEWKQELPLGDILRCQTLRLQYNFFSMTYLFVDVETYSPWHYDQHHSTCPGPPEPRLVLVGHNCFRCQEHTKEWQKWCG